MLSSSLDTLLKVSKTTCPKRLFANDCVTLYQFRDGKRGSLMVLAGPPRP